MQWLLYAIAIGTLLAVAWKRIGVWDKANDELERRRRMHEQ